MMMRAPEKMPADPKPAIARPTINVALDGATPQIRDPISKTPMAKRNTTLIEKKE